MSCNNKKSVLIAGFVSLFLSGCSTTIPGHSTVPSGAASAAKGLVLATARLNAQKAGIMCGEKPELVDSRVVKQESLDSATVRSYEVWTVTMCGHALEVPISITPDGHGEAYLGVTIDPK